MSNKFTEKTLHFSLLFIQLVQLHHEVNNNIYVTEHLPWYVWECPIKK